MDARRPSKRALVLRSTLVLLLACAGAVALPGCGSPTSPKPPDEPTVSIHLYPAYGLDPSILCSRSRIKVIYFVPKGQEAGIYAGWQAAAQDTFGQVKMFFEREFEGHLRIETDILDTIVFGEESEYPNEIDATNEIETAVFHNSGAYYDAGFAMEYPGEYAVRMVFFVNGAEGNFVEMPGGAYSWNRYAYNPWFWLEEPLMDGIVGSAHEFGHLLGMPHPWEMDPPYPRTPGDIMSYETEGYTLMQCFVMDEMKRRMGLSD